MKTNEAESLHWSERQELTGYGLPRVLLFLFSVFPTFLLKICTFPVALVFYLCAGKARQESRLYLTQMAAEQNGKFRKNSFKHFWAFAITMVEKIEAWGGKVPFNRISFQGEDVKDLVETLERGKGALLICSHLGNSELLRGLADFNRTGVNREVPVTSIVDVKVTAHFNRILRELNPRSTIRIISAGEIGPDTVILLQERIARGELVVIAGDRTSEYTRDQYFSFPFLGRPAPFGRGAFFLAALLEGPIYSVFALRPRDISLRADYNMYVYKSPLSFDCSRKEREPRIEALARDFAARLEEHCKGHPYQWYNFFDFWALPVGSKKDGVP